MRLLTLLVDDIEDAKSHMETWPFWDTGSFEIK